jgi:hypothetical protein
MSEQKIIDDFINRAQALFGQAGGGDELRRNARALVSGMLQKLDVVSREEFEAQREVLARTRAKIDALEQQIDALSKQQS